MVITYSLRMFKHPRFLIYLSFFILYFAIGGFLAYELQVYHNDAVARTALGFFTAFGRNPHLAAVGFVWQPLPSLLQVPLLFLLRPLGLQMLAGPTITAVLGAASVILLFDISELLDKKKRRGLSALVAILYGLNPMMLLYVAIGSSEVIFMTSLIASSFFLLHWLLKKQQISLVLASFFLALAFGSRYESIPAFAGGLLIVTLVQLIRKEKFAVIEGSLIQFVVPFIYAVMVWIVANWAIMGNPFYFLNSVYSNAGFTNTLKESSEGMEFTYHSILNTLWYCAQRTFLLAPGLLLIPVTLLSLVKLKRKQVHEHLMVLGTLLAPYLAILAFHGYQLFKGESFGWLRFFIYGQAAVSLFAMYLIKKQPAWRFVVITFLVLGFVTSAYAMSLPKYGKEENSFVRKVQDPRVELDYTRSYADQKRVAEFMDSQTGMILIDTDEGFAVPLFAKDPTRYIITSDIDYLSIVENYQTETEWVIVPSLNQDNIRKNIILKRYPGIWDGSEPRLKLHKKIDGWGVFEVLK